MQEETSVITSDLLKRIELAAISAAKEILSGRRILDVEGPFTGASQFQNAASSHLRTWANRSISR